MEGDREASEVKNIPFSAEIAGKRESYSRGGTATPARFWLPLVALSRISAFSPRGSFGRHADIRHVVP